MQAWICFRTAANAATGRHRPARAGDDALRARLGHPHDGAQGVKQTTKKAAGKAAKETRAKAPVAKADAGFSAAEKAAMKDYLREKKAAKSRADGEADLLAKVAEMPEPDRGMATIRRGRGLACSPRMPARALGAVAPCTSGARRGHDPKQGMGPMPATLGGRATQ